MVFLTGMVMMALEMCFVVIAGLHFYWSFSSAIHPAVLPQDEKGKFYFYPERWMTFLISVMCVGIAVFLAEMNTIQARFVYARYVLLVLGLAFILRAIGDFHIVGFLQKKQTHRFTSGICVCIPLYLWYWAWHFCSCSGILPATCFNG